MPSKHLLQKIDLTDLNKLQTLVENRRVFNLNNCELNIYESFETAHRVPLSFHDLAISSMVRGKKIMHLNDKPAFEYMPGETVIIPPNEQMIIDFPEATLHNPTQCIAVTLDNFYVNNILNFLNNHYNVEEQHTWKLHFNQYHFENDTEITELINKLIRVCTSGDSSKNILADLNLKELLIRLIQSQHLQQIRTNHKQLNNFNRPHFVINYIHEHLTEKLAVDILSRKAYLSRNMFFKWFKEQFGITPLEYINKERIKLAKQLLTDKRNSISDVSLQCGFNDVNYFVRLFKKIEGITPGTYRECL